MTVGCIIVYDFPSENIRKLESREHKRRVANTRIKAFRLLRKVGLSATESVFLVPKQMVGKAEQTVRKVKEMYSSLESELANAGVDVSLQPDIRIIELTRSQYEELIPMVRRRILMHLQESLEIIEEALNKLREEIVEEDRKRIRSNIIHLMNEWERTYTLIKMVGINIDREFRKLEKMVREGLEQASASP
jgi:predicted translin family RNA/ssDNA-binding protein